MILLTILAWILPDWVVTNDQPEPIHGSDSDIHLSKGDGYITRPDSVYVFDGLEYRYGEGGLECHQPVICRTNATIKYVARQPTDIYRFDRIGDLYGYWSVILRNYGIFTLGEGDFVFTYEKLITSEIQGNGYERFRMLTSQGQLHVWKVFTAGTQVTLRWDSTTRGIENWTGSYPCEDTIPGICRVRPERTCNATCNVSVNVSVNTSVNTSTNTSCPQPDIQEEEGMIVGRFVVVLITLLVSFVILILSSSLISKHVRDMNRSVEHDAGNETNPIRLTCLENMTTIGDL
jgi:uncharacterized membrane protein YhaH (DUF805 family)